MSILKPNRPDHEGMLNEVMERILVLKPALKDLVADLCLMDHSNRHNLTDAQRGTLTDLHKLFNELEELTHGPHGIPAEHEVPETVEDIRRRLNFTK